MRKALRIQRTAWFTPAGRGRWGVPTNLYGDPGGGKSECSYALAEQCRMPLIVEIPAIADPTDYRGLGVPVEEGNGAKRVRYLARLLDQKWTELLSADRAVVLFDEGTAAAPAVQAALLRVFLERVLGDTALGGGVRIGMAVNPPDQVAGHDLILPFINRMVFVPWEIDEDAMADWREWLVADGGDGAYYTGDDYVDPAALEAKVLARWPEVYGKWRGTISAYASRRGVDRVQKVPKPGTPESTRPYPTFRSMTTLARICAGMEIHGNPPADRLIAMRGTVGEAAGKDVDTWITQLDLPEPTDLLDGREKFAHNAKRFDRTVAVLERCAGVIAPPEAPKRIERAAAFWALCGGLMDGCKDLVKAVAPKVTRARLGASAFPERGRKNPAIPVLAALDLFEEDIAAEVRR